MAVLLASASGRRSAGAALEVERGVSQSGQTEGESQDIMVRQLFQHSALNLALIKNARR
jgi:hypothetical protein